jgi:hypothetical protein
MSDLRRIGIWSMELWMATASEATDAAAELDDLGYPALWILCILRSGNLSRRIVSRGVAGCAFVDRGQPPTGDLRTVEARRGDHVEGMPRRHPHGRSSSTAPDRRDSSMLTMLVTSIFANSVVCVLRSASGQLTPSRARTEARTKPVALAGDQVGCLEHLCLAGNFSVGVRRSRSVSGNVSSIKIYLAV